MPRHIDVAIIGGGQAGLAMSQVLSAAGTDHIVFERGHIGERWHAERWAGLKLLTPAWMTRLPGFRPPVMDPQDFMPASTFACELRAYARHWDMPVLCETHVLSLAASDRRFAISTSAGDWSARAVVIATGACDQPAVPVWAETLSPTLHQVTPSTYRHPRLLPAGGVLVVGASATGVQLAEEIQRSGRQVTLAAGRHVSAPRTYRGRDIYEWLEACDFFRDLPSGDPARLRTQPSFQLIGSTDRRDLDLAHLISQGVRVVGRAEGGRDYRVFLKPDLEMQCAAAEARRHKLLQRIDCHIAEAGAEVASDPAAWAQMPALPASPGHLDLRRQDIRTIVWATGYRRRYPWLRVPVLDADGEIRQCGGVTPVTGLFTLGLPFMRRRGSAMIDGVGRDAEDIGALISMQLNNAATRAAA